jgi:hypothetical protein
VEVRKRQPRQRRILIRLQDFVTSEEADGEHPRDPVAPAPTIVLLRSLIQTLPPPNAPIAQRSATFCAAAFPDIMRTQRPTPRKDRSTLFTADLH